MVSRQDPVDLYVRDVESGVRGAPGPNTGPIMVDGRDARISLSSTTVWGGSEWGSEETVEVPTGGRV